MKKLLILISPIFLSSILSVNAQWHGESPVWTNSNVGIGVANPNPFVKLTVQGEIHINNNNPYVQFNSSYWGDNSYIQTGVTTAGLANGDYMVFYNPASKGFNFRQDSYNALTIHSNRNIGIGTPTPAYKLDVVGDINFTGKLLKNGVEVTGGTSSNPDGKTKLTPTQSWGDNVTQTANMIDGNLDTYSPTKVGAYSVNIGVGFTSEQNVSEVKVLMKNKPSNLSYAVVDFFNYSDENLGEVDCQFTTNGLTATTPEVKGVAYANVYIICDDGDLSDLQISEIELFASPHGFCEWSYKGNNIYREKGNVGIGTTSPGSKLVIAENNDALSICQSAIGFNRNVIDGAIFNSSKSAWQFTSRNEMFTLEGYNGASPDLITFLKNGNVGIGVTMPTQSLEVKGNVKADLFIGNGSQLTGVNFNQSDLVLNGSNSWIMHTPDDGRTTMFFAPNTNNSWDWANGVQFANNGSLTAKSFIGDGSQLTNISASSFKTGDPTGATTGFLSIANANCCYNTFADYWGNVFFRSKSLPANNSTLALQSDGTVVIGGGTRYENTVLDTQGAKLMVNGIITAEKVRIIADVPNYDLVFSKDYRLRSLYELESFVKANSHLPDVPSSEQFKKDGYSVGEMDGILLRQVEELALYSIQLKKENDALKAQLESQMQDFKKELEQLKKVVGK